MRAWFKKNLGVLIFFCIIALAFVFILIPSYTKVTFDNSLLPDEEKLPLFSLLKEMFDGNRLMAIGENLSVSFGNASSEYLNILKYFFIFYVVMAIIIFIKLGSRKEYENIEHGSGDWATTRRDIFCT